MKVYVEPPKHLSQAMFRVARALEEYAPMHIHITKNQEEADLLVHHVIGFDAINYQVDKRCAVIQYCFETAGNTSLSSLNSWRSLWHRAELTWSYYDLSTYMPYDALFYYAPLGIDKAFREAKYDSIKLHGAFTSGYVTGPDAEAIEEVAQAANAVGLSTVHLGPMPVGLTKMLPKTWQNFHTITDIQLADIYSHTKWVSGLRHVEGFELPVVEGLACGARPVVFDRPEMRHWFGDYVVFVPECSGIELVNHLANVFSQEPKLVTELERQSVLDKFNWESIIKGFWSNLNA